MTVIGNVFNGFLGLTNQLDFKCWIKQASAHLVKYYVLKWCQQGFFFFQFAEVVKIFFFFSLSNDSKSGSSTHLSVRKG